MFFKTSAQSEALCPIFEKNGDWGLNMHQLSLRVEVGTALKKHTSGECLMELTSEGRKWSRY